MLKIFPWDQLPASLQALWALMGLFLRLSRVPKNRLQTLLSKERHPACRVQRRELWLFLGGGTESLWDWRSKAASVQTRMLPDGPDVVIAEFPYNWVLYIPPLPGPGRSLLWVSVKH